MRIGIAQLLVSKIQDLYHRRSAYAVARSIQRPFENVGGAAAARGVYPCDNGDTQTAGNLSLIHISSKQHRRATGSSLCGRAILASIRWIQRQISLYSIRS